MFDAARWQPRLNSCREILLITHRSDWHVNQEQISREISRAAHPGNQRYQEQIREIRMDGQIIRVGYLCVCGIDGN